MTYTKKQIYYITNRLYKELRKNTDDIVLRKMRAAQGQYDYGTDKITIDYRRDLLSTLIHEYLHKWHPNASETWVLQNERLIINALTTCQIKRILYEFANSLYNV